MKASHFMPSRNHLSNNRGYSLVELLIVITITGLLLTLGTSAYRRTQDRQEIRVAGETIEKVLIEAQKQATSGEKDCSGPLSNIEIVITATGNTLTNTAQCSGGNGTPRVTTITNATFDASTTILFRPLNAGIDITSPPGSSVDIDFTSYTGLTHRIIVSQPGDIKYVGDITP